MKNWGRLFTRGLFITLLLTGVIRAPANASRGVPGSPEFGIGARISLSPEDMNAALSFAKDLRPDWLSIDLDWNALNPEAGQDPDWSKLDVAVEQVFISGAAVMLSLANPPAWTITNTGPDASITADFVFAAATRYGHKIEAIELFPSPNTSAGWGAPPNPSEYFSVYQAVAQRLTEQGNPILLVSGGLETDVSKSDPEAQSDLDYLAGLYSAGANTAFPVIGLRFSSVNGLPSAHPNSGQRNVLRHYEEVRRLMTSNGHVSGILWITYLGFPDGTTPLDHTEWLAEAYAQIRTQLYIGVAFLQGINTCYDKLEECREVSLLSVTGNEHPFVPVLRGILAHNAPKFPEQRPGRGKSEVFRKHR